MASATPVVAEPNQELVAFDATEFQNHFNRRPFFVRHQLCDHPLFELSRLVELARELPEKLVEYNAGDLPVSQDPNKTPRNGLSPEETIRRIEECRSWLVLKNVELQPEYAELLDQCLAPVRRYIPVMTLAECFIFVSSPGAVTPYHIDPEYNFLLQIRGSKTIHMFDPTDPEVLNEPALEAFYCGASRNLVLDERLADRAWVNELKPGFGLHFPITAPHWVKNGPEVSISFSITFRDEASDRREVLYRINSRLRKLGIKPKPVGTSAASDGAKYAVFRVLRGLKKMIAR
jgi:ribosomal protein L16 Arg81 hydroxylase